MHDFLSEEWVIAAREIRERYADDVPELPVEVRINQVITDAPFEDDTIEAYIDTSNGILDIDFGAFEDDDVDVTITTDYEFARALLLGGEPQTLMQGFLEGRIRVQGDMTQLIALQAAIAQQGDVEAAQAVAADIQAMTN